jgi:pentose-5-phosphate-3-epimerase
LENPSSIRHYRYTKKHTILLAVQNNIVANYNRKSDISFSMFKMNHFRNDGKTGLEVDGGIDENVASDVIEAGANALVAGSYIFSHHSCQEAIQLLKAAGGAEA